MADRSADVSRRAFLAGFACAPAAVRASAPPGPEIPPFPPGPERPGSRLDAVIAGLPPWLDLSCRATGETWQGWVSMRRPEGPAADDLAWFLRDWRESVTVTICARVLWALCAAGARSRELGGSGRVEILSGYRTPVTNAALPGAARDSFHMYGRAADIRADALTPPQTASLMQALGVGGVGRYPGFTHIDSGPPRTWTG